jgi:hypothetical protein
VVKLETQYWTLLDVPKQEKQEPVGTYVLRACVALEKVQVKPSEKSSAIENEESKREEKERLEGKQDHRIQLFLYMCVCVKLLVSSVPFCR